MLHCADGGLASLARAQPGGLVLEAAERIALRLAGATIATL